MNFFLVFFLSQWIGEVLHYCHGLPYFLVGCKKDLRHDPDTIKELKMQSMTPVTYEQVRIGKKEAVSSVSLTH